MTSHFRKISHINSSFPSSFMQAFYPISSSNHHFSTPTLKTLPVGKFILSKTPTSTFLLITFFPQVEKFDKMHH